MTTESFLTTEEVLAWLRVNRRTIYRMAKAGAKWKSRYSGRITHMISALDSSWTTRALSTAKSGYVTFDELGTHTYHCADHPWAMGQVTVEP